MSMNEFKTYHPIVNFTYFVFVIGFSCFFMHPVCLGISLFSGFSYAAMLGGRKKLKTNLLYMVPMFLFTALINPVFSHEGVTILGYLPGGNPLTKESVVYGLGSAAMLVSVICHFSCFNEVMTRDKILYLFSRIAPGISLLFSMTLRFVPRFTAQFKVVADAQKCMGRDITCGSIKNRVKCAFSILSGVTTWALENAVTTADSMKARGYGLAGRTAFSIFKMEGRDKKALLGILGFGVYILLGNALGGMDFQYFPSLKGAPPSAFGISTFLAYGLLLLYPGILEFREGRKWNTLRSKL